MKNVWTVILSAGVCWSTAVAQVPNDAFRLGTSGFGVGARAMGMGNAYTGIASDYSALYYNPAGLAQLTRGEFSFGLSYLNTNDRSTFFGNQETYSNNATNLNMLGFVYPVPVRRGNLVFALGFDRQTNFTSGLSFSGFNPSSSIIQTYAPDGQGVNGSPVGNPAWELFLADTSHGLFVSPIHNRVTQLGQVTESGGLNNWSVGGAIDVARDVSLGVTLTYVAGSYRYDQTYTEQDKAHLYLAPFDFKDFTIDKYIESDISGVNAKFGLMYRVPERLRFGLSVKTPTAFNVRENFGTSARTSFHSTIDGNSTYGPLNTDENTEYDVTTPWVFGAGASVIIRDLVISGDVEYTDWTQLEFSKANQDVMRQNKGFKTLFRATANLRAGAEYEIPRAGIRLRGGFTYNPSPYTRYTTSSYDQKIITGGVGFLLGTSTMLDLGYAHGWWLIDRVNYDDTSRVGERMTTNTFLLTLSYRY
jgi:long-subunit fatty acid transport protein